MPVPWVVRLNTGAWHRLQPDSCSPAFATLLCFSAFQPLRITAGPQSPPGREGAGGGGTGWEGWERRGQEGTGRDGTAFLQPL